MTEVQFTDDLRPIGVEERPLAWWGMLLTMAVLVTTYVALYFSYIYIRVGTVQWPPEGFEAPPLDLAGFSALALAASALPLWWATRREVRGGIVGLRIGILLAIGLAGVHAGFVLADFARTPFVVSAHAYASLFYVLPGFHLSVLALALLMAVVVLGMAFKGHISAERHIGVRCLGLFWFVLVGGGLGILAVVYGLPHLWPTAQVGS